MDQNITLYHLPCCANCRYIDMNYEDVVGCLRVAFPNYPNFPPNGEYSLCRGWELAKGYRRSNKDLILANWDILRLVLTELKGENLNGTSLSM